MALRVVLAYSGGLDTSVIVPWLREKYDAEVICVAADVGQPGGLEGLDERVEDVGDQERDQQRVDDLIEPATERQRREREHRDVDRAACRLGPTNRHKRAPLLRPGALQRGLTPGSMTARAGGLVPGHRPG